MTLEIATDDCWPPSGIGTFAKQTIEGLERAGHQMTRLSACRLSKLSGFTPLRPAAISAGLLNRRDLTFYSPGFYPPARWRGPTAVTVHDLQYLNPQANPSIARRRYFQRLVVPLLKRCDLIMTVSPESQDELAELLGPGHPVTVVGDGVDEIYFLEGKRSANVSAPEDRTEEESADVRFRLTYVGNWLTHKRADVLLAAAVEAGKHRPIELSMPDNPPRAIARQIERASGTVGSNLRLRLRPRLKTADLASHVASSDLLVLLSTHEGFGLTPLEAQAAKTPILVSEFRGARSRYGERGAHFLPVDAPVEAIAQKITDLADDSRLCRSTVEAGTANAESLRWPDVVARVERALTGIAP